MTLRPAGRNRPVSYGFRGPCYFYPLCYPFLLALLTVSDLSWGTLPTNSVPHFALIHLLPLSQLQSREIRECGPSDTVIDSDLSLLAVCLHQLSEKSVFGTTGEDELLLLGLYPGKSEPRAAVDSPTEKGQQSRLNHTHLGHEGALGFTLAQTTYPQSFKQKSLNPSELIFFILTRDLATTGGLTGPLVMGFSVSFEDSLRSMLFLTSRLA